MSAWPPFTVFREPKSQGLPSQIRYISFRRRFFSPSPMNVETSIVRSDRAMWFKFISKVFTIKSPYSREWLPEHK